MKHGDLSNEMAPVIGLRFENIVYNFGKVNGPGKALCEGLLSRDCNLYLFSTLPERKVASWCYKWGLGYTRIIEAAGPLEIPELCINHHLTVYYDTDERLLAEVSMRGNPQIRTIKWEQPLGSTESASN